MNKTELLEKFHEIAVSPRAQMDRYLAEGKKVVLAAPVIPPKSWSTPWVRSPWACGALT